MAKKTGPQIIEAAALHVLWNRACEHGYREYCPDCSRELLLYEIKKRCSKQEWRKK